LETNQKDIVTHSDINLCSYFIRGPSSSKKLPVAVDLNISKPANHIEPATKIRKEAPKITQAPKTQPRIQQTKSVAPKTDLLPKKVEPLETHPEPVSTPISDSLSRVEKLREWRLQKEKLKPSVKNSKSKNTLVAGPRPPPSTEKPKSAKIVRPDQLFSIPVSELRSKIHAAKMQTTHQLSLSTLEALPQSHEEVVKLAEYWIEVAHYHELLGNMTEVVKSFEEASIQGAQVFLIFFTNCNYIL
jgi:hypothetical protein